MLPLRSNIAGTKPWTIVASPARTSSTPKRAATNQCYEWFQGENIDAAVKLFLDGAAGA